MVGRKWLVWLLGIGLLGGAAVAAWLLYACTNPEAVRQQVLLRLQEAFPDADVQIDGASLRLLGGVWLHGVRLTRHDDPTGSPFLEVPSALLVHDKEHFARTGELRLRKLELIRPRLRLERRPDGRWSCDGLLKPGPPSEQQPIIVVREGSVILHDRLGNVDRPPMSLHDCQVTLINDPVESLTFEFRGACDLLGPVSGRGSWQRDSGSVRLALDLPAVTIGRNLVRAAQPFAPDIGECLDGLSGVALVHADLSRPRSGAPWKSELRARLRRGGFRHPRLPLPATDVEATASCADGHFKLDHLTAKLDTSSLGPAAQSGPANLDVSLQLRPRDTLPADAGFEDHFQAAAVSLSNLPLTAKLFAQLPEELRYLGPEFQPVGPVDLTYRLERTAHGWERHCTLTPRGVTSTYELYRYPIRDLRGRLDQVVTSTGDETLTYDLTGTANGRPLRVKGRRDGHGPTAGVSLDITGQGLVLDPPMIDALPADFADVARQFHVQARGDVAIRFERPRGQERFRRYFLVTFTDGSLRYDVFPYPQEKMRGVLDIAVVPPSLADPNAPVATAEAPPAFGQARRSHCLFRHFEGSHRGAHMVLNGRFEERPDGNRLILDIQGRELPLDSELAEALAAVKLTGAWQSLAPRGRLNFNARVIQRHPPEGRSGPADLELGLGVAGATIQPVFFPYEMTGAECALHYAHDRIELVNFQAVHGTTRMSLAHGDLRLKPHGGVWADLTNVNLAPLPLDRDFLGALPAGLRQSLHGLEVQGLVSLHAERFTIDAPTGGPPAPEDGPFRLTATEPARRDPAAEPWIYWDGTATLHGIALKNGVPWQGVVGTVACRGEHRNGRLGCLRGGLWLEQAQLYHQPVQQLTATLYVDPKQPDWLQLPDVRANLFGGEVGGEARVGLGPKTAYDLDLTGAGLRLDEVARYNQLKPGVQLSGQAGAHLHLSGRGDGLAGLTGAGALDVPSGRIADLPQLIDLLKVLHGRAPDRTAFDEAHATFKVRGPQVRIDRLDLFGDAVSLGGEGSVNLKDQSLKLNFYGIWSQFFRAFPEPLRELTAGISQNLFQFEVRGQLGGKLKSSPVPVPALVGPLRDLIARFQGRGPDGQPAVLRANGQ